MKQFDQIEEAVAEARLEWAKMEEGNKSASTRARNALQNIRMLAQSARVDILDVRKKMDGEKNPSPVAPKVKQKQLKKVKKK